MSKIKQCIFVVTNCAMVVWQAVALTLRIINKQPNMFVYFTVLSNLFAMVTCAICVVFALQSKYLVTLYSWATYLLAFAFMVPLVGASTQPGGYYKMFFVGEDFVNHLVCPVAMVTIYLTCLPKTVTTDSSALAVSTILLYGTTMYMLNAFGVVQGPYFFFEVHRYTLGQILLMLFVLVAMATLLSLTLYALKMREKRTTATQKCVTNSK